MTDNPRRTIERLRERIAVREEMSDDDGEALQRMTDQIELLGPSEFSDDTHAKYLMRGVTMATEVGGLADALDNQDAAETIVKWIHTEFPDSPETNKTCRNSLRQFGRLATDGDEIPESIAWVPGGYPKNYDPAPVPANMLRWEEDVLPMVDECHNLRDQALIVLAWDLGPRPGSLFDLTVGQFSDHDYGMKVTVNDKKGRRSPIIIPSVPYVKRWLAIHPGKDDPNTPFISDLNSPTGITDNRVRDILKEKARNAGVTRPVTPRNFRKSSASHLASQGVSQAHLEDHHGWTRGSNVAARYIAVFGEANDREVAKAHGVDVEEDEPDPTAPVTCHRCQQKTPRERGLCVWCGQALSQEAVEEVNAQQRRWMSSAGDAADHEDVSIDDVLEARDIVEANPALKRLLLGTTN